MMTLAWPLEQLLVGPRSRRCSRQCCRGRRASAAVRDLFLGYVAGVVFFGVFFRINVTVGMIGRLYMGLFAS